MVVQRDHYEAWREEVDQTFLPLSVRAVDPDTFRWSLRTATIGTLQLTRVDVDPETVSRTPRHVAADDNDHLALIFQLRESCAFRQGDREVVLAPGQSTLYDCARPFELRWTRPHRALVAMFRRDALDLSASQVAAASATPVSATSGLGAVVLPMLLRLADGTGDHTEDNAARVSRAALDLMATLYREKLGETAVNHTPREALAARIRAFIDSNLNDPSLSTESIAAAHRVSVRYLHKAFEDEGISVSRLLRTRRLEECRRDLADPRHRNLSVAAVAARHGLLNASHFSHSFRVLFGEKPRDFKNRMNTPTATTGAEIERFR